MRCRGLTLIELVVVIGIIALLLGLLIPALNRARAAARRAACASQLAVIDRSLHMYANDWDGWPYPEIPNRLEFFKWWLVTPGLEDSYAEDRGPYLIDLVGRIRCPEDGEVPRYFEALGETRNVSQFSYVFNGHLQSAGIRRNRGTAYDIPASSIVLMGESIEGRNFQYMFAGTYDRMVDPLKHRDGSNYLWLDGHVSHTKPWQALPAAIDPWDVPTNPPTKAPAPMALVR